MSKPSVPLLELNSLLLNPDLETLFSTEQAVFLELWVIKVQNKTKLLYSMISASTKEYSEWFRSDLKSIGDAGLDSRDKVKVGKTSITASGAQVLKMFQGLLVNKSLEEAIIDSSMPKVHSSFSDLRLGIFDPVEKEFAVRPAVIGVSKNVHDLTGSRRKGLRSPEIGSLCIVGSLFRLDKDYIWRMSKTEVLPRTKDLVKNILDYMTSETGLSFSSVDSKRLGNVDWISYPSSNHRSNPYCKTEIKKKFINERTLEVFDEIPPERNGDSYLIEGKGVRVKILDTAFREETFLIVECAAFNSNDLLQDFVLSGTFPTDKVFDFNFSEQVSSGRVKVWRRVQSGEFQLWFDEHFDIFRTMSVSTSIEGFNPQASKWLDDLITKPTESIFDDEKLKVANVLNRFEARRFNKDFSKDPWNPVSSAMTSLAYRLYPGKSDAYFMTPGNFDNKTRILELSNWINGVSKNSNYKTCVIFDPFFDTLGVDVLLNTSVSNMEFVAVTNSECSSNDDEFRASLAFQDIMKLVAEIAKHKNFPRALKIINFAIGKLKNYEPKQKTERFNRIKNYCEEMKPEFKGRAIRILDLQSSSRESGKQFFHDRYVFFFDKYGHMGSAYNFSNSIQGAMTKFPLLITPVPKDVLEPIQDYIHGFLHRQSRLNSRQVVTLFSHQSDKKRDFRIKYKEGLASLNDAPFLFSIVLNDPSLKECSLEELKKALTEKQMLSEAGSFILDSWQFNQLTPFLDSSDIKEFERVWRDIAEILARTNNKSSFNEYLEILTQIKKNLKTVLLYPPVHCSIGEAEFGDELQMIKEHLKNIGSFSFSRSLDFNRNFSFSRYHFSYLGSYFIKMAEQILLRLDVTSFVEVADYYIKKQNRSDLDTYILCGMCSKLEEKLIINPSREIYESLLVSKNEFLKSLFAQTYYESSKDESNFPDFLWMESKLTATEMIQICAEWSFDLRVLANQKGGVEPESVRVLRLKLFDKILEKFPLVNDLNVFVEVARRTGGPLFGSWAMSNYGELGLVLEQQKLVSFKDLAKVWLEPLLQKIKAVTAEKNQEHFYSGSDPQLTAVGAHIFSSLELPEKEHYLDQMESLYGQAAKHVSKPRIKSMKYDIWYGNIQIICWLYALLLHISSNNRDLETDLSSPRVTKLVEQLRKIFKEEDFSETKMDLFVWTEDCQVQLYQDETDV